MNNQIKALQERINNLQKRIDELEEKEILKIKSKVRAKREISARNAALKLCKKCGINYRVDEQVIWAYISFPCIDKYFDGIDPWEDNHHFDSWQDLVFEIQSNIMPKVLGVQHG